MVRRTFNTPHSDQVLGHTDNLVSQKRV